jgi:glycosyltransferase involved in cell wall biosynthesis
MCRNHIDHAQWPERIERDGPLRVGFMGSTSHLWDVSIAYTAIHAAHSMGCETHMIGYNPGDPDPGVPDEITADGETYELRSQKSKDHAAKWRKVISKHTGWINPTEYHRASLPLDIGLCPLKGDEFNFGRSDVKAIEYAISGAAVVCMNNPVYNSNWTHEVNCLMAGSAQEMAVQTLRLIKDPQLRYELVTAAQEYVRKERGLVQMQQEWRYAISG